MDGPESTVYADLLLTNAQQHDETTRSNPVAHNVDSGGCYKGDASTAWQEGPPAVGYHTMLTWARAIASWHRSPQSLESATRSPFCGFAWSATRFVDPHTILRPPLSILFGARRRQRQLLVRVVVLINTGWVCLCCFCSFVLWWRWFWMNKQGCLTSESVDGAALALEGVDDVERGDGLALGVLGVGDGVADDVLEEVAENGAGLLVDQTGDALDTSTASKAADGRLGDALDVVTQDLAVALCTSLAESLASLATSSHCA